MSLKFFFIIVPARWVAVYPEIETLFIMTSSIISQIFWHKSGVTQYIYDFFENFLDNLQFTATYNFLCTDFEKQNADCLVGFCHNI